MRKDMMEICEEELVHSGPVERARAALAPDQQIEQLAAVFKALGDPTRVRIIQALLAEELCVCDLADVLGMTQSSVSHQLRVLRNLHIVRNRRDGKEVFYRLDDDHVVGLLQQAYEHVQHTGGTGGN